MLKHSGDQSVEILSDLSLMVAEKNFVGASDFMAVDNVSYNRFVCI